MPEIVFDNLVKRYDGTAMVIDHVSAVVPDKEFLVLVGPSGCGKSTMLRMIAGLIDVTSGSVLFDGRPMENVAPKDRDIAFVFQSYALYPHLTVRANIAFPLLMARFRWWHHIPVLAGFVRRRAMRSAEIASRVQQVADMLKLGPLLDRKPGSLSGGQRQRVALARALVRDPAVYLLDEPLSNLDAALRTQMRAEIIALHRRVQKNFIFVTHDQVEAMTMGTRIIVLDRGVVQQYATPREIYERPANTFVARFIGVPAMNLLAPTAIADGMVTLGDSQIALAAPDRAVLDATAEAVLVGLRPEKIRLATPSGAPGELLGTVQNVEYLGADTIVGFRLDTTARRSEDTPVADDDTLLHAKVVAASFQPGDRCRVELDLGGASYFSRASGLRVETRPAEPHFPTTSPKTETI